MNRQQILAALARHNIKTVGDLDHFAQVRGLSRWHALAQIVGEEAADRIFGEIAVKLTEKRAPHD